MEKFAEIQKEFNASFKHLFGGGHGALELVEDEDKKVRYKVINNPSTPVDILRKLAEDKNWSVRAVAEREFQKRNSKQ